MDQDQNSLLFSDFPPIPDSVWEERIHSDLKGADYRKKLIWDTGEGFEVRPYYRAAESDKGFKPDDIPGMAPFMRGRRTSDNTWLIREDIREENPEIIHEKAKEALERGATALGINVRPVSTHRQMSELLPEIDLAKVAVNFTVSPSYPLTLELFIYEIMHREIRQEMVRGSLNFDPVSYLLRHGRYYMNWVQNIEEAEYLVNTVRSKLPGFKAITINGHIFQDAGSTLVQELAYTLASANEYLTGLTDKGLTIDQVAPYMQLSFAAGPNYFFEIAKLRAARLLWSLMIDAYGPSDERSKEIFIHVTTAQWNKSIYDPYVNMLRTTTEGMSAILGNADSVTILPFDLSYRSGNNFSSRIARNQQLVLKEESYFDKVVDPAGGSYYIEYLTGAIARGAWDLFRETEAAGGLLRAIHQGTLQAAVMKSRRQKEEEIARRRMILLGTNQFPNLQEVMADSVSIPAAATHGDDDATYEKLLPYRAAAPFEALRFATEGYVRSGHPRPGVFLLTMGQLAMLRARAGFITNFFGCAGYEIIDNPGFSTVEEGVQAAISSGCPIVAICSSDEEYPAIVPSIAEKISSENTGVRIVVAGYPKEHEESFRQKGVYDFIHVKSDLLATLKKYHEILGIR